ncbi:VOC family protein [Sphingomonas jeddahensis]|uniref:Glyoxalase-like domain protein n=1 Tax=Sphingomonas jeddahensis TaxID=1915074 RepID=A0A1V2EVT5_9SPHN|nr:VOC family protein [Sphingomonas jeddahensis]ONF96607.1 Glyoxalase-like domain protein [Sphingomonas jeddahensis]
MTKMIFVNLPVTSVAKATAFYEALGFTKNAMFSNEQASAMEWSESISVMLLHTAFYRTFTDKALIDARTTSGVLLCISRDSRQEVDAITEAAIYAGGRETRERQDMGFMYSRAFEDLDGHTWEPMFMDMAAAAETMGQPETVTA